MTGGDGLFDNEHERCNFDLFRSLKSILVTPLGGHMDEGDAGAGGGGGLPGPVSQIRGDILLRLDW